MSDHFWLYYTLLLGSLAVIVGAISFIRQNPKKYPGPYFVVTGLLLLVSLLFINTLQVLSFITLRWWNSPLDVRNQTYIQRFFVYIADKVTSGAGSTELVVTGDHIDQNETAIIIANHQTEADWWYIWFFAKKYGKHGNIKIALKKEVQYLPIFGWGCYLFDFLFLSRKWEQDEKVLRQKCSSWAASGQSFWYLIFPEGTTIQTRDLETSHAFSQSHGRPKLNLLLLPRIKGLKSSLECLSNRATAIYDLTIAYPTYSGEIPTYEMGYSRERDHGIPNFMKVLRGNIPDKVSFHVTRYDAKEALNQKDFTAWADSVFVRKEELLNHFIKHKAFPATN